MNATQLKALDQLKEEEAHLTRHLESLRNQASIVSSTDFTDARIRTMPLAGWARGQFGLKGPNDFDWYDAEALFGVREIYIDVDASAPEAFAQYESAACCSYNYDWVDAHVGVVINNRDGGIKYCYKVMPYEGDDDYGFDLVRLPYTNFIATERQRGDD